jgi:hypothetical protein
MIKKLTVLILLLAATTGIAQDADYKVNLRFDRYYTSEELNDSLRQLNQAYPQLTELVKIGESYQGRDMWVLKIYNTETGDEMDKPAMWVDANIHGNEIQGGEVVLYIAWYLLENYDTNPRIREIVDRSAFYLLPSLNPDGREYWLAEANTSSTSRSGVKPIDDDGDGLKDEDGPDDLDGDGHITQMRKKVSGGNYKLDPEDPRLLVRVEPGEEGKYDLLGYEGIDNDGDGRINEDSVGGYDPNRNWGYNWMPNYVQGGAGDYPFSLPESRNVQVFFDNHPNIAGVQSFHNTGGMILRAPGAKNLGDLPPGDVRMYDKLGKTGELMLPGYRYMIIWKDLYTVYGGSIAWTASGLGIFSFSNELNYSAEWDMDREEGVDYREKLQFSDHLEFGELYKEWEAYDHPLYGEIEIGGWTKWSSRVPPVWKLRETCHRNAAFVIYHAESMPEVIIEDVAVKALGNDLYRISATIKNERPIPTRSDQAAKHNLFRKDFVRLSGESLSIVTAGTVIDKYRNRLKAQEHDLETLWVPGLTGYEMKEFQWIVKGSGTATIEYDGIKVKNAIESIELR